MKPLTRTLLPLPMRRSWQTTIFRPINTASSQYSQIFRLPDGRALGYADYGSPTGYPVIYCHGYPSSRLEGFMFDLHGTLHRNQIRLIAPDRPGFGLSTVKPDRRIMDWPADVKVLAQHLGLSHFAVLGCSGAVPMHWHVHTGSLTS
ncbi:hypothetical protein NUU61_004845 [Penicillium alfredii]|uniref:AB hydrolase-1 domain-containing protein n=1 Tax=Penicillium alfredii TaxID=1506179 RepID=A0A9W9K723_9EURO|nr:uncharacterized protein NUU61_004845 [Penicillium alfredii]KAJ5095489.1 hypothetical protein NUU61_004845 [Penicillium alfredii]